jgi:polyisoprenoid-binding protein YceI
MLAILAAGLGAVVTNAVGQQARGRPKVASDQGAEHPRTQPGDIDLAKSRIYVLVGKTGLGHEHAIEGKIKSGKIHLGATRDAGVIEFDMPRFSADTDEARKYVGLKGSTSPSTRQQVNKNMLGPDVLDVKKYPTATLNIDSALQKQTKFGAVNYEFKGKFTLHGKSRSLTILAEPSHQGSQWRLAGDFTILQSEFGITPYSTGLGTIGVADSLRIWGDLWVADEKTQTR